ncbi:hypothetical protein DFH07DRAFT_780518 [Mycena maculata]|uniref:Cell wall alpha-1,3-glucan synthase Mok11-14/Ags1-like transmembrane domain-containing protein n=1 Tax=Mycena maculata TaxID=230809 RepID=A0AAD7I2Q1_9AGAR|nr:hypothetical protein DFH07DRAFT_780518 [Mycena maculata]
MDAYPAELARQDTPSTRCRSPPSASASNKYNFHSASNAPNAIRFGVRLLRRFILGPHMISATSYQMTLLTGKNYQNNTQLYILGGFFLAGTFVWYPLFRLKPSIWVLGLPWFFFSIAFFLIGLPSSKILPVHQIIAQVATWSYSIASAAGDDAEEELPMALAKPVRTQRISTNRQWQNLDRSDALLLTRARRASEDVRMCTRRDREQQKVVQPPPPPPPRQQEPKPRQRLMLILPASKPKPKIDPTPTPTLTPKTEEEERPAKRQRRSKARPSTSPPGPTARPTTPKPKHPTQTHPRPSLSLRRRPDFDQPASAWSSIDRLFVCSSGWYKAKIDSFSEFRIYPSKGKLSVQRNSKPARSTGAAGPKVSKQQMKGGKGRQQRSPVCGDLRRPVQTFEVAARLISAPSSASNVLSPESLVQWQLTISCPSTSLSTTNFSLFAFFSLGLVVSSPSPSTSDARTWLVG